MPVKVEIYTRNMDLNEQLQQYVEKKVGKLDRYLDVLEDAKVDLRHDKAARNANDRQIAQLTVRGKGVLLRAEERTDDIFASVDAVLDKINRQIERFKGRRWKARGDGRSAIDALLESVESLEEDESDVVEARMMIARRKRFQLTPMDEMEAIEQMSLLGHEDFFVFLNAETDQINVLYRRRDESLGLIEPEIG